jgi:transcriptional regulator NrdR family protein
MRCPSCDHPISEVKDSRPSEEEIRRRRRCAGCGCRFTTFEAIREEEPKLHENDIFRHQRAREMAELFRNLDLDDAHMILRIARRLSAQPADQSIASCSDHAAAEMGLRERAA